MARDTQDPAPEDDDRLMDVPSGGILAAGDGDEGEDGPPDVDVKAISDEIAAAEVFVEERVQRSLARFRGMFPPEVLEEFADELRCFLLTHPVTSKMLARIRPRAGRVVSGEGAALHAAATDEVPGVGKGSAG